MDYDPAGHESRRVQETWTEKLEANNSVLANRVRVLDGTLRALLIVLEKDFDLENDERITPALKGICTHARFVLAKEWEPK